MDVFSFPNLATPLQILLVDLLLGADNALLIGLAGRALPRRDRRRAAVMGIAGAVALRLLMTVVATSLLDWPLVKFVGAVVLTIIALNLISDRPAEIDAPDPEEGDRTRLWRAAAIIVVADAVMSLDNVVALAAIAQGNFLWLLVGVGLSLPMLGYGGMLVADTLHQAPGLASFGGALLGWIAGGMAVSDAHWAQAIEVNAPGFAALAPALGAAFVYLHGCWVPRAGRARFRPLSSRQQRAILAPSPLAAPGVSARLRERKEMTQPEGRVMLIGMLGLALLAGGFLALVAYYGGLE